MAKYTTQLRSIVESQTKLFDFEYPLFDESYRPVLEKKIIDRYYFREIGFETVGQFKWFLRTKLNEIMPYYNEHYRRLEEFKTYDPYTNKDMTTTEKRTTKQDSETTATGTSSGESTSESNNNGSSREVYSDTPQGKLANLDYATNLTDNENEETTTGKGTSKTSDTSKAEGVANTTDDYIQTIKGFDGMKYASEVYMGIRETLINIDTMILDELNDLFMNVY